MVQRDARVPKLEQEEGAERGGEAEPCTEQGASQFGTGSQDLGIMI